MLNEPVDLAMWDATLTRLSSRAERLIDATSAFTPTVFLDALLPPKDQVVYGRRGTGKTHLFRRLENEYDPSGFDRHRTIASRIDASELTAEAYGAETFPQITAVDIFGQFVKKAANDVCTFLTNQIDPNLIERMLGTGKAKQLIVARQQATLLTQLVETGEVHYLPMGEASQTTKSLHETAAAVGARVSVNLTDLNTIAVKVGASAAAKRSALKANFRTVTILGRTYLPFTEIARVLRELLDSVLAKQLVIMIDEWSAIDFDAQPYLAQLLKRVRQSFGSSISQVHFKLGCIPTRTQLSLRRQGSPIPIGMEEGDDIFPDANLDRAVYFDRENDLCIEFLQDVLRRHAAQSLPWIGAMEPLTFARFLGSTVFASGEVFSELCWASAGVPRDFLDLVSKATRAKTIRAGKTIDFRDVREVVRPVYEAKVKDIPPRSIELSKDVYSKIVFPNRSYAEFLLSSELARLPEVSMLWVERLWHLSPEKYVDPETGASYERYRIDYGTYVDLVKSKAAPGQSWYVAIGAAGSVGGLGVVFMTAVIGLSIAKELSARKRMARKPIGERTVVEPRKLIADPVVTALIHFWTSSL